MLSRRFLQDVEGDLYKQYRSKIEWLRHGFKEEGKGGWCMMKLHSRGHNGTDLLKLMQVKGVLTN